ncbi:MAG: hypothetical protein HYW50_02965 [Candidatus Diapherotrites archaeon]|nr:hypothetical protein [Candidatus Diapherotrites archaeon]
MEIKIIASIGPSSLSHKTLNEMIRSGLKIARLKSSFYTPASLEKTIKLIRKSHKAKIMVDLEGSEIRLRGKKRVTVKKGNGIWVSFAPFNGFYFNHDFFDKIKPGKRLFYDKDETSVIVKKKDFKKKRIFLAPNKTTVFENGKGFNAGKKTLVEGKLSEKDLKLIPAINRCRVEIVALSFTQSEKDVRKLKKLVFKKTKICAKIENHEGLKNLARIIMAADMVVVARGDLTTEFGKKNVPQIQKKIVSLARRLKKPVVVASYIFSSMEFNPAPLKKDVLDLLKIAKEGANMIWIDSPTAVGKYPAQTIAAAGKTLERAKK